MVLCCVHILLFGEDELKTLATHLSNLWKQRKPVHVFNEQWTLNSEHWKLAWITVVCYVINSFVSDVWTIESTWILTVDFILWPTKTPKWCEHDPVFNLKKYEKRTNRCFSLFYFLFQIKCFSSFFEILSLFLSLTDSTPSRYAH